VIRFPFVLCADDYGLSPAVSAGILEALAARRINATGAMTNRPNWRAAAADLRALDAPSDIHSDAGRPQFGIHLNLTLGAPLSAAPDLAPHGRLPAIGDYLRGRIGGRALAQAGTEIARQFDAFEAEMGRPPDFVDGHQHVHVVGPIADLVIEEAARRGWQERTWLRDSADRPDRILRRRVETTKALALVWFGRGFAQKAKAAGFSLNEGFAGFSAFDPARDYAADFARYLAAAGPRHLVMCHPGHVDEELAAADPVTVTREKELAFLLSDKLPEALEAASARLAVWER
jgi:predicted glycoside hydrolase/deacetylase ChbG (UPF0249 family)